MRRLAKYLGLLSAGAALAGVSCTTDLRDSLINGVMDYVSGNTTDLLNGVLPLTTLLLGGT